MIATILLVVWGLLMGTGTGSTLVLRPTGRDAITFNLTGSASRSSGGYVVDLGRLKLNEDKRLEIAYSGGANVDGGEAISSYGPLVPVTFDVVVYGTSRSDMMDNAEELMLAVTNEDGGTLEYKPEDVGASVRSTFYHYEQSPTPGLRPGDRWDASATSPDMYRLQMKVELQTQPFATSDTSSPVVVKTATTVYNQDDGLAGYVAITGSDVKGTIGALTQLRVRNLESGAWNAIKRLFYFRRSKGTLGNFSPVLEGGTADTDSSIWWSTESDNTRRSNNFQRYAPPEEANDQWAYLEYSVSNPTDHEGRAAVLLLCRSVTETADTWDLKASIEVSDLEVETSVKNPARTGAWHAVVLGEVDIPPTPISDDESYSPVIKVWLRRTSGDEDQMIDIDFVMLFFVDEYPQQVTVDDGFTDSYRLLLENFGEEMCHVVAQDTLAFDRTADYVCPLLQLKPGEDQRVYFLWERLEGEILDDDFEDYEPWRWLKIADCETDESWTADYAADGSTVAADTTYYVEGSQGVRLTPATGGEYEHIGLASLAFDSPLDLAQEGRFTDDDFVYIAVRLSDTYNIAYNVRFYTDGSNYFGFTSNITSGELWNYLPIKRENFEEVGSPDWASISKIGFRAVFGAPSAGKWCTIDDWRAVRADPDAANKGNDTGPTWDFVEDVWHIEEQESTSHALGCVDIEAGVEKVAVIHEEPPADIKYLAKVKALRDDGDVGLVFRCEDSTGGSEDMAAFFIDTSNDELELRKWAAGAASDIATAVSQTTAADTDYYLGVQLMEDTIRCYFGTSLTAIWDADDEEFVTSAQVFDETDSDLASGGALEGGQAGVLSIGTLGRFDDVKLYAVSGHVPGDTVEIYLPAVFRSVYPFRE